MVSSILVVDGDRNHRGVYRRKLSRLRACVHIVESADQALDLTSRKFYDIIIIQDKGRKECNGPSFYNRLRKIGYKGPILVLTSNPSPKRETYNGILDLVHKAISGKDLCNLIESYNRELNLPQVAEINSI